MSVNEASGLAAVIADHEAQILSEWLELMRQDSSARSGRITETELGAQCRNFLGLLGRAAKTGSDTRGPGYEGVREFLAEMSRTRALQGFTPVETATFVFSLKRPLFTAVTDNASGDAEGVARAAWEAAALLDQLGLFTMDAFQKSREAIIIRQQQEISELSTPVVKLWDGVLALPLIGTLDSERTQVVMENLLQSIVDQSADIAIIDITGVPTVDTLVAQHLLKTVAAARLMGADCIVSGIRPQIAQTMVHLGVELNVISKARLADAFAVALQRQGRAVVQVRTKDLGAAPMSRA